MVAPTGATTFNICTVPLFGAGTVLISCLFLLNL
jgi:hypothetical protein